MSSGLAIILCLLGCNAILALPSSRLLEGEDATSGEFPYMVSLRKDNAHKCGGAIISEWFLLTAGSCVSEIKTVSVDPSRITARVGSTNQYAGGIIVSVDEITIHPSYGNFLNDLALVKLSAPLTFTDKINKIDLLSAEDEVADDTEVVIAGWGLNMEGASPYKLRHTTMKTLAAPECEYRCGFGYDSVVCLDHKEHEGGMRGDEGAGVVAGNKLVGILSFAFGSGGTKYPDIAGFIPYHREWIDSVLEG